MQHFYAPFEIKAGTEADGTFVGLASTFGNVDSYGDTVAKGAFEKTIADAKSGATNWPVMLLHHGGEPIGSWLDFNEDARGLRMKGQIADTTRGREVYALLKMQPRSAFDGLSIGYRAKDFELHRNGSGPNGASRSLKTVDLHEVSLVTFPADKFARVASVKSWGEPVDDAALAKAWAVSEFEAMRRLTENRP